MKMVFRRMLAAGPVLASLVTLSASAQDLAPSEAAKEPLNYLGVMGSYLDLDKGHGPKDGTGVDAYYGRQIGGNFFIEGHIFTQNFETDQANFTDFYHHGGGLDLVYSLGERRHFSPFILLGGGAAYSDVVPDHRDATDYFGNAGLGFVTQPIGYFGLRLRAEARYVYDDFGSGQNDFRYSAGIELPLSPYDQPHYVSPPPAPAAAVVAPEVRTEVVTEKLQDSDGDGVPDQGDKCPSTPQGMPVDGVGCGLSQVLTLTGVTFDFDKATLTPDSRKILEDVALKVKHFVDVPMELEGHTDSKGSDDYNLKLSDLRAKSVRDFLIEQGVPGAKLTARGFGEKVPVADNNTEAGRALNRRVELRIAGQQAPSVPVDASGDALGGAAPTAPVDAATPTP